MLAIIIPYYKITFFEATLQSLAAQTDKRFKVYIGDDYSPENPQVLLEKYEYHFDFVYHRFESNLGGSALTKQWERCIKLLTDEEWLMILGDDDVLGENVVEAFYGNLAEIISKKTNVIRFSTYKINQDRIEKSVLYTHPKIEKSKDFFFKRKSRSSLSEYIFNRNALQEHGFKNFPLGWYSDVLAVMEVSNMGNVFSINSAFLEIRISGNSISGSDHFDKQKEKARVEFYSYLILEKNSFFEKGEIPELLHMLNKTYLNNKKNIILFLTISNLYIKKRLMKEYFIFIKTIFKRLTN